MEQKTINQNKLQTLLCIIALTLGVLVSAVLFSMPPVHAEESNEHIYMLSYAEDSSGSWPSRFEYSVELHSTVEIALIKTNFTRSFVSGYSGKNVVKYGYFPIYLTNDKSDISGSKEIYFGGSMSRFEGSKLYDTKEFKYFDANSYATFYSVYYNFTESSCSTYYNDGEVETDMKIFNSIDSARLYVETGDTSGIINGESPNTTDESYTFTGFSINGKTARWTGTTERSYLKDQEVEEYTTITYAWATTTEPDNIGEFQTYNGEFPTSDKQLKLPWSDMENNKNDNEFIRQVNLIPCYRVSGAFYHGSGVKVFYKSDGTVERTEFIKKQTDLNTGNMVYDSSIGYLQSVIYTEEKTHDGKGRQATFKWSTSKSMPSDAQVEIVAKNFYIEWFNKTTEENFVYKEYGEDCIYSVGSYSFNANTPVWTWLNEKDIDPFSVKTQSYGTKEYYLRIITYNDNDNMYHYGGWVRVNVKTKDSTNMPTTDVETGGFDDDSGLWDKDLDSDDSYHYSTDDKGDLTGDIDIDSWEDLNINSFTWMYRNLQSMTQTLGQFPSMVSAIFGFLPSQVITALSVLLVAVVLLRFLGR